MLIEALLLIPTFIAGYLAGGLVGVAYWSIRFDREIRERLDASTLQPFAIFCGVVAMIAAVLHWQDII